MSEKPNILTSIVQEFTCSENCGICDGCGIVCEDHYWKRWDDGDGCCGAPGMPCPGVEHERMMA